MHRPSRQRSGRADARSDAKKDLFDANTDAAPKKEKRGCDKKEIAFANTYAIGEEKGFAIPRRSAHSVAHRFSEKETHARRGSRISNALTEWLTPSKEKAFADSAAVRIAVADRNAR